MATRKRKRRGFKPISSVLEEVDASSPEAIKTGLLALDHLTSGLSPGHLIVVGSRPRVGKTSLVLSVAEYASIRQGLAVGIFSLEGTVQNVASRILAAEAEVPLSALLSGGLTPSQQEIVLDTRRRLRSVPLFIDAERQLDIDRLVDSSIRAWERAQLDLLVVDYVQLLRDLNNDYESRAEEFSSIVRKLKHLAREIEIPILAVSQVSVGNLAQPPSSSDLENATPLIEHSDLILLVHRNELSGAASEPEQPAEIIVAKNRTGPERSLQVAFLPQLATFRNLMGANDE